MAIKKKRNTTRTISNIDSLDSLSDISCVKIEGDTPAQRLDSFLTQVKDPYCFRVGNTPVRVAFSSGEKTLESLIKRHFLGLKH